MKTLLYIQNLKCGGCEATIVHKLSHLEGIKNVAINIEDKSVKITHETIKNIEEVKKQLYKLGYPIVDEKNSLGKKATSYVSCFIGKFKEKVNL